MNHKWISLLIVSVGIAMPAVLQGDEESGAAGDALVEYTNLRDVLPPERWREVEEAIDRGLAWLATQQNADGSFPGGTAELSQPGVTSYVVIAFLSRGHQPGRGEYGASLSRAAEYVLSKQREDGSFGPDPESPTSVLNHPFSGMMLSEVYGVTSGPLADRIEAAVNEALAYTRSEQAREKESPADKGGWRYHNPPDYQVTPTGYYDWRGRRALPYAVFPDTAHELLFLRSASNAGFEVPQEWVDEGLAYAASCYIPQKDLHRSGVFRWRHNCCGNKSSNLWTALGAIVFQSYGRGDNSMVADCLDWIGNNSVPGEKNMDRAFMGNYYCARAMAGAGRESWDNYFPRVVEMLLRRQAPEGYWRGIRPAREHPEEWFWGSSFNTAVAVLTLTLPDQVLPVHQQ